MGKVENCQVGVFMGYVKNGYRLLLDFRLYLPKNRTDNRSRCDAANIPPEFQRFKTKAELAYDLICQAIEAKIKFSFVAMDGFYGKHPWLLTLIEKKGVTYVADIGSNEHVIIEKPEYGIPPKKGIRGRKPSIIKVLNTIPVSVEEIQKTIDRWRIIRIRESTDGFLEVKFTALRVWRTDKDVNEPIPVWLLIRKDLDDSNVKYSFCNDSPNQTWSNTFENAE